MKKDIKTMVLLVVLIISGAISWNLYFKKYTQADTVNIHLFPKQIDGWVSEELTITELEYAILETKNAFARQYTSNGKSVTLFVVYSQNNRKVSHPPELCYSGSGFTILGHSMAKLGSEQLGFIDVNRLLMEERNFKQVTFYWFKVGENFTPSYWQQQMLIAGKTLLGKPSSSALIRLSSPVVGGDVQAAEQTTNEFFQAALPNLIQYLPSE